MQDRQQRTLIYNERDPPHPDPSSRRATRTSRTFPRRATRTLPRNQNLPSPRNQNLSSPRNQNLSSPRDPEPEPSFCRSIQNVPDSSRSRLVVMAAACRYSIPSLGLEFLRERSGWAFLGSVHGRHPLRAPPSSFLPVPMLAHRILSI